jgi:hypothetical protein
MSPMLLSIFAERSPGGGLESWRGDRLRDLSPRRVSARVLPVRPSASALMPARPQQTTPLGNFNYGSLQSLVVSHSVPVESVTPFLFPRWHRGSAHRAAVPQRRRPVRDVRQLPCQRPVRQPRGGAGGATHWARRLDLLATCRDFVTPLPVGGSARTTHPNQFHVSTPPATRRAVPSEPTRSRKLAQMQARARAQAWPTV